MDTFVKVYLMLLIFPVAATAAGAKDAEKAWSMAAMEVALVVALTVLQIV